MCIKLVIKTNLINQCCLWRAFMGLSGNVVKHFSISPYSVWCTNHVLQTNNVCRNGISFCIFISSIIAIRHPKHSVTTSATVGTRHVLPRVSRQRLNNAIGHQSCMLNYTAHFCSPTFHLASVFCNFLFPLRPLIFPWSYFRGKGLILYDLLVSPSTKTIYILPQACPVCPNIKFQSLNRVPDKRASLIYVSCLPPPPTNPCPWWSIVLSWSP
jgi:hypothetical protein